MTFYFVVPMDFQFKFVHVDKGLKSVFLFFISLKINYIFYNVGDERACGSLGGE